MIPLMPFDCPRTCREFESRDVCRFRPVLDRIGPVKVNSHTAKIKVEYTDPATLRIAVERMGGVWIGPGHFSLGDTEEDGIGFRLPMKGGFDHTGHYPVRVPEGAMGHWLQPCVLRADGELAYDEYRGAWGDLATLTQLRSEYAFATAEVAALNQGWLTERTTAGELLIHHPSGGTLTISAGGTLATAGFTGGACHEARLTLGMAVEDGSIVETAEGCQVAAVVSQGR